MDIVDANMNIVNANTQGKTIGNIKNFTCPRCGLHLVKTEGKCDCEYTCCNPACRGSEVKYPSFYGYTQEDINNNVQVKRQNLEFGDNQKRKERDTT